MTSAHVDSDREDRAPEVPAFDDLDAWSNAVVAAALKMLWVQPSNGSAEVRRRLARAEALRKGRDHQRRSAPVPESAGAIPFDTADRV